MILYPAIDLMSGQCVRLYKGDFERSKMYEPNPVEVAERFKREGATWLHLVDLDGARDPEMRQISHIKSIVGIEGLSVQTGGGVRTRDDVATLLDAGADRVVIGSLCVKDPDLTRSIIQEFGPDKIVLAMDVTPDREKGFVVATSGWQEKSEITIDNLIEEYRSEGFKHMLCTDISLDGTMQGTNIPLYQILKTHFSDLQIQASGGIKSLDDLEKLQAINIDGAIMGRAIYEGAFTVQDALQKVQAC